MSAKNCPSLPGLKEVYKYVEEELDLVYQLNQHRQWQPQQLGMFLNPSSSSQPLQYHAQQYNTMWKNQPPFSNWSQKPFPSSSPWSNQASQSNWPNFPYTPPYWQNNAYPMQWFPPTSQSQA